MFLILTVFLLEFILCQLNWIVALVFILILIVYTTSFGTSSRSTGTTTTTTSCTITAATTIAIITSSIAIVFYLIVFYVEGVVNNCNYIFLQFVYILFVFFFNSYVWYIFLNVHLRIFGEMTQEKSKNKTNHK